MEEQVVKQRITYVDAMKGLSILLVVLFHCQLCRGDIMYNLEFDNMLCLLRMPLFFCLSGLFFKRPDSFRPFVIKKINQLVVPYVFFTLISFFLFPFVPIYNQDDPMFFWDVLLKPQYNMPLWFLRVLFLVYICYYVIDKYTSCKSFCVQLSVALCMLFLALVINRLSQWFKDVYSVTQNLLEFFRDIEFLFKALFFFFVAQQVKRRGWVRFNLKWSYTILLFFVLFVSAWYLSGYCGVVTPNNFALHGLKFLLQQFCSLCMILAIALLFAKIKFTKLFEFFGKNSLVVLVTHCLFLRLLGMYTSLSSYEMFFIVTLLMFPCIFIFNRYLPQFVAKKEFFKLKS